jgi:transcriptional regulator
MYRPDAFRLDDRRVLLEFAAKHPFATVITCTEEGPEVSHLPLLVDSDRGLLRGHLARQNPQVTHFAAGREALTIFHGPHGYVSPSVYAEQPSVPTWNYVVVHARGRPRFVNEDVLRATLDEMVTRFDETGWHVQGSEEFLRGMVAAIVGFEIPIGQLEGKWKVSQNRSLTDQANVAAWLARGDDASRALVAMMRARR